MYATLIKVGLSFAKDQANDNPEPSAQVGPRTERPECRPRAVDGTNVERNGRPLGPPLSALPPGRILNGLPRAGYMVTPGPGYGPERSYGYPYAQIYRVARVVDPVMSCAITAP